MWFHTFVGLSTSVDSKLNTWIWTSRCGAKSCGFDLGFDLLSEQLIVASIGLWCIRSLGLSDNWCDGDELQASAACIASKVTAVSQFASVSNWVQSKVSSNSSKTRCIDSRRACRFGVRPVVCSAREDVDCGVKSYGGERLSADEVLELKSGGEGAAEVNPWQRSGGRVFALVLATLQAVAPIPFDGSVGEWGASPAEAVLYSPDTKVPRSAEVALRRAIPAVNTSMKKMQESLEDIFYLLRIPQRKPYGKFKPFLRILSSSKMH